MEVTGRCHCGAISYRAVVDPDQAGICHCTDCQRLTGSAYRVSIPASAESFTLLGGQPKIYVKTAESGNRRVQAFCAECGSPIYSCAVKDPPLYMLRIGGIDQRASLAPRRQIWCRSAMPWSADIAGLPKSARE